ncbi:MAG: GNAT family N-acetyltransferase [Sedimentisphaerales bacterium]|nr:GNAT family N-acetyltransferase [Sedimentisphaerales bacterium]
MKEENNNFNLPDGWEISLASTLEDVEAIRPAWEKMQNSESSPTVDADIDRYLSVMESTREKTQPYVITLSYKNEPAAMIIAKTEMRSLNIKLGYKTILNPKLKCLTVVYGGILGEPDNDVSTILMSVLMKLLRSRKVSMVFFNHLKTDSHIYTLSRKAPGIFGRNYFPSIESHWVMSVPDTIESFYKSCSTSNRKQYKKCIRRLENTFPDKIRTVIYSQENDLDETVAYISGISAKTYQYSLGCGVVDNSFTRALLTRAAQKGWLRIHVLFIDNEPSAFETWMRYGKAYHGHGIGFDPKWKKWRIGTVLFLKTIEHVCNDTGVDNIDFGFGDADYKQSYGDKQWNEANIYIFAPRFYPICINILRTCIEAINSGLKNVANKSGLTNRIKRLWRNRLEKKNP